MDYDLSYNLKAIPSVKAILACLDAFAVIRRKIDGDLGSAKIHVSRKRWFARNRAQRITLIREHPTTENLAAMALYLMEPGLEKDTHAWQSL